MDDMRYAAIGGRLTLCTYQFKGACNHLTVSNQLMFLNFPTIELNPIQYLSSTDYKPSTVVDVIMAWTVLTIPVSAAFCAWLSTRVLTLPPNSPFNATKPS